MKKDGETSRESRFGRLRWFGYTTALLLALGMVSMLLMVEVSSQPQFCGSCHVMEPYFDSWQHSSHKDVDCVDCHIPPGVAHEVRKKWEALSMVASYFTGTYGTKPWAEIDDASCLRCHERRLLAGKELFRDVLFDHTPHLTDLRRGKKLRCTSCHSQIVQGQHIAVTSSTCILCHFKGATTEKTSRCTLCHQIPEKVIQKGLLRFDHADVKRFDMKCDWCHAHNAVSGGGEVPTERCFTCHGDPERLQQAGNIDLMHRTHVTDHKVDCLHCHLEIQHGRFPESQPAQTSCERCHSGGHSPQRDLYAGIGGKGVAPLPAPMFTAGVACEGCHFKLPGQEVETARASEVACMSCHGPRYRPVLARWKESVETRAVALRRQLQATAALFKQREPESLSDARHNLELVERGHGVHNPRYAFALMSASHDFLNQAREAAGQRPLPVPWPSSPYQSPCLECHQGIEGQAGAIFRRNFSHRVHVVGRKLECQQCHRTHDEKPPGEVVRFASTGCNDCHHSNTGSDCLACHGGITSRSVASFRGEFDHSLHLGLELSCSDCHRLQKGEPEYLNRELCAGCHE